MSLTKEKHACSMCGGTGVVKDVSLTNPEKLVYEEISKQCHRCEGELIDPMYKFVALLKGDENFSSDLEKYIKNSLT